MIIPRPHPRNRHGFSFAEVMFAVVILGVGFIMIAGIFPVALQQTQSSSEQSNAAGFARDAAGVIGQIASTNNGYYVPSTQASAGAPVMVLPFDDSAIVPPTFASHAYWPAVSGNIISASDNRFAVVPLYSRPLNTAYAQLYIIGVQATNRTGYGTADLTRASLNDPATLQPKLLQAYITPGSPSLITFASANTGQPAWFQGSLSSGYTQNAVSAVATGTYVIVANDNNAGVYNGQVYRVGPQRQDQAANTWELVPGSDFVSINNAAPPSLALPADVWIVGRGLQSPGVYNASTNPYAGVAQDISLYTTFVAVP